MNGLEKILDELKKMMDELFDGYVETDTTIRSFAGHLGITGVPAIVEAALEAGVNERAPYPILHFMVTLASNVPEEYAPEIKQTLHDLNLAISVGGFPSFGCFCYEPELRQIFLNYRMPVFPEAPEQEIVNIRYYLGALYEEMDLFADFIMFICDSKGKMPDVLAYLDYLNTAMNVNDIRKRAELLEERIRSIQDGSSEGKIAEEGS